LEACLPNFACSRYGDAGKDGTLQNAGFLDYRMPVASDLRMIDAIIVEVPNPRGPVIG
jgi:CO/xanthine dehydrogenase Mo-binding subunit